MMRLSSPSFRNGGAIPRQHTPDGANLSPALAWSDVPSAARSLVLLMEDSDAPGPSGPGVPFVHWILYNLQASSSGIELGANRTGLPTGARSGLNDYGRADYDGPDPPGDPIPHHYVFRLYAVDRIVRPPEPGPPRRQEILEAIESRVLDTAELTGTYRRPQPWSPQRRSRSPGRV